MKNKYLLFLSTLSICFILSGCYVTTHPFKTVMHVSTLGLTYLAESYEESDKEFWKQWEANMANLTPEQKEQLRLSILSSYVSTSSYTSTPYQPTYSYQPPKQPKAYNYNIQPTIIGPGHSGQSYYGTIQETNSPGRYHVNMNPSIVGPGYSNQSYSGDIQEVR